MVLTGVDSGGGGAVGQNPLPLVDPKIAERGTNIRKQKRQYEGDKYFARLLY